MAWVSDPRDWSEARVAPFELWADTPRMVFTHSHSTDRCRVVLPPAADSVLAASEPPQYLRKDALSVITRASSPFWAYMNVALVAPVGATVRTANVFHSPDVCVV